MRGGTFAWNVEQNVAKIDGAPLGGVAINPKKLFQLKNIFLHTEKGQFVGITGLKFYIFKLINDGLEGMFP